MGAKDPYCGRIRVYPFARELKHDKVHFDLVFSRWHPDGTRYLTIPALWIMTRSGDHWGIQLRSLMPATLRSP